MYALVLLLIASLLALSDVRSQSAELNLSESLVVVKNSDLGGG